MIRYATLLLFLQLIGEVLVVTLKLPIPGPVMGMALLFSLLMAWDYVPEPLEETANGLLNNLSLLFVPAGVGVMLHMALVKQEALPILASIVIGTLTAMALTALFMAWMNRLAGEGADGQ